jgi:hypothetical protein
MVTWGKFILACGKIFLAQGKIIFAFGKGYFAKRKITSGSGNASIVSGIESRKS